MSIGFSDTSSLTMNRQIFVNSSVLNVQRPSSSSTISKSMFEFILVKNHLFVRTVENVFRIQVSIEPSILHHAHNQTKQIARWNSENQKTLNQLSPREEWPHGSSQTYWQKCVFLSTKFLKNSYFVSDKLSDLKSVNIRQKWILCK